MDRNDPEDVPALWQRSPASRRGAPGSGPRAPAHGRQSPAHGRLGTVCAVKVRGEVWPRLFGEEVRDHGNAGVAQHLDAAPLVLRVRIDERNVYIADAPRDHL